MTIQWKPVKNFWVGRSGYKPQAIVIHIGQGTLPGAYAWFNNPTSQVSSHYMVGKKGEIWQFVKDEDTAWHAGGVAKPSWSKLKPGVNPNLYTIGIEHEGFTGEPFTSAMYSSTSALIAQICKKFGIKIERSNIIGHYEINSVSRPNCPGRGVDLNKLITLAQGGGTQVEDPKVIKELQDKVNQLQAQNTELQKANGFLTTTINSIKADYLKIQTDNASLKSTISAMQQKIDQLVANSGGSSTGMIQTLTQQNSALRQEVLSLQQNQVTLNKKITDLQNQLNNR